VQVFQYDGENGRRLVASGDPEHTLRGFYHRDDDADLTITVAQQFGPMGDGSPGELMVLDGYVWPGGQLVAHVVRQWKRGHDYGKMWTELRRQVRISTGVDIGEAPYASARGADRPVQTNGRGRQPADTPVLVWQKNPRPPVVHASGSCPTLARSSVPPTSTRFNGPGTAGWLPVEEARQMPGAGFCERCTTPQ
jgi:hypothetical protein